MKKTCISNDAKYAFEGNHVFEGIQLLGEIRRAWIVDVAERLGEVKNVPFIRPVV